MLSAAHAARPETGQECPTTQGTRDLSQRQRLPPRLPQPRSLQPRHQPPGMQTVKEETKAAHAGRSASSLPPRRARRSHLASGRRSSRGSRLGPGGTGSSPSTGSGSACPQRAPGSPAARGTREPPARRASTAPPWPIRSLLAPGSAHSGLPAPLRSAPLERLWWGAPRPSPFCSPLSLRPPQVRAKFPPQPGPAPPRPAPPRSPRPARVGHAESSHARPCGHQDRTPALPRRPIPPPPHPYQRLGNDRARPLCPDPRPVFKSCCNNNIETTATVIETTRGNNMH